MKTPGSRLWPQHVPLRRPRTDLREKKKLPGRWKVRKLLGSGALSHDRDETNGGPDLNASQEKVKEVCVPPTSHGSSPLQLFSSLPRHLGYGT